MKNVEELHQWLLDEVARLRLRLTPARVAVLAALAKQQQPFGFETIASDEGVRGLCDFATVFRFLTLLAEADVLRMVHVRNRVGRFVVAAPGTAAEFLVCDGCGSVKELPPDAAVTALLERATQLTGFAFHRPELELFGLCPECQHEPVATSVPPPAAKD